MMPNVENIMKDEARGITYRVMAYRTLTRDEIISSIGAFLASRKRKKLARGVTVTIMTIIGHDQ